MTASEHAIDRTRLQGNGVDIAPGLWAAGVDRSQAGGELSLSGIGVSALAAEFGTPLFCVDESDFRSRAQRFSIAFDDAFESLDGADVYYASKAFLCTAIAKWVNESELWIDVCSAGELAVALRAGIAGEQIAFHGNNKSDHELRAALDAGVGRIVVDSLSEIDRLAAIADELGVVAPVMVRVTVGVNAHTHEFIATAHEDQKFGLSIAGGQAMAAVTAVLGQKSLRLLGIHSHIGSQILDPDLAGFRTAIERVIVFRAEVLAVAGVLMEQVDLGGGYGIAYTEADAAGIVPDISSYARAFAAAIEEACERTGTAVPHVSIEPGRAIAGPSTFTLYTVGTVKPVVLEDGTTRTYVSVDGGMSDNIRTVLYDAEYTAVIANRASSSAPVLCRVVGKHCEAGDIVVRDVLLPGDIAVGDLLAVPATGAYGYSMASNYNHARRPAVVAVSDGAARVIVRRETPEDILRLDVG